MMTSCGPASREVIGHALTLSLLGGYLKLPDDASWHGLEHGTKTRLNTLAHLRLMAHDRHLIVAEGHIERPFLLRVTVSGVHRPAHRTTLLAYGR